MPDVGQPPTEHDAASSALSTFVGSMVTVDSIPRNSEMPQVTSQPGSSQMRLGSWKPHTHKRIPVLPSDTAPDSSMIKISQLVEPGSPYRCILCSNLGTIWKSDSDEEMVTAPGSPKE